MAKIHKKFCIKNPSGSRSCAPESTGSENSGSSSDTEGYGGGTDGSDVGVDVGLAAGVVVLWWTTSGRPRQCTKDPTPTTPVRPYT